MFNNVNGHLILSDAAYNVGKKLVQVILPAISALYFGLGAVWGFPYGEQVVGSMAVFITFLGVCLGFSSKQYDASGAGIDGELVVTELEADKKVFSLELADDPEEVIEKKKVIKFKVATQEPEAEAKRAARTRKTTVKKKS